MANWEATKIKIELAKKENLDSRSPPDATRTEASRGLEDFEG